MSPNTQVALIALVLFFAVASVSIFWPRLAGLEAHRKGRSLSSRLQTFPLDLAHGDVAHASHQRRRAGPRHHSSLGVLAAQHGPGTALLRLAPRSCDPVCLHLGSDAVPSNPHSPPDLAFWLWHGAGDAQEYGPCDPHGSRAAHLPDLGWGPTPSRNAAFRLR